MAKKSKSTAASAFVKPSPRYFSILLAGWFSTSKSTFIHTISGSSIGLGHVVLDEDYTLLLYEPRSMNDFFFFPGEWLGMILMVNSTMPQFFPEARNTYQSWQAYTGRRLPFIVVDSPFNFSHWKYEPEIAWDVDALRWALKLDSDVPVIQGDAKNREMVKTALVALLEHFEKALSAETYNHLPFELVYTEQELFTATPNAYWLCIVNTSATESAELFMAALADEILWLSSPHHRFPMRMGYCELDEQTRLYLLPMKGFAFPTNSVQQAFDSVLISPDQPNFATSMIGCVGIINFFDEGFQNHIHELIRDIGSLRLALVDKRYPPPDDPGDLAAALPFDKQIPIIHASRFDKPTVYAALRLLTDLLPAELAALFRQKFGTEKPAG